MKTPKSCTTCRHFAGMTNDEGICLASVQQDMHSTCASKLSHHVMERDDVCDEWATKRAAPVVSLEERMRVRHALRSTIDDIRVIDADDDLIDLIRWTNTGLWHR